MINLLPQHEKDALRLSMIKNLSLSLGLIITVALLCFIFVLLSVKFYVMAEVDDQKFLYQSTQENYKSPNIVSLKNAIEKYNKSMPVVAAFYENRIYLGDVLSDISNVEAAEGLNFTNLSLEAQPSGLIRVSVSGISDTRENLISFQKELEEIEKIQNLSFSADSWINPVNANFKLVFELKKNDN